MRVGLYGLPTAGKSFILNKVASLDVMRGSALLKVLSPNFSQLSLNEKDSIRKRLAFELVKNDNFIMDGHYAFGDEVVFTEADGNLYDVFLYLYIEPNILKKRMEHSDRNRKYLQFDIAKWQLLEIDALRSYCHEHNKDFYVIDNPEEGYFSNIDIILSFIDDIVNGYSCCGYARECSKQIIEGIDELKVTLTDGDKTLIIDDSSSMLGYKTHIFDGNFYTGFQSWRHTQEMEGYLQQICFDDKSVKKLNVKYNLKVINQIEEPCFILTSGVKPIWEHISDELGMIFFYGKQMSSDTKYFIVKALQNSDISVTAYGDSMNDYYMLKQADNGYLVLKNDGTYSRSLVGKDMEGISYV
jgi:hypothetical protein